MTSAPLTNFQVDVLALANDGKSNREIAAATEKSFNCIVTTLSNIERKGHRVRADRPLDAAPAKALARHDRKWQPSSTPRFTATGVKLSTGERFEITSDSQAHSDECLAYMTRSPA